MFVPFVLRIPSRSTDVHLTIQFVRFGRKEWKGKEEKGMEKWRSGSTVTNLEDIFSKENYMSRLRITHNERAWMFTSTNVKTFEEFFLCKERERGGRVVE